MLSRRGLLTTGAASVVVAGLAAAGYAHGPGLSKAIAPWNAAGSSFGDARLDALAYAILAPNPHNRQPWWFELVDDDKIDVYCDLDRLLPHTDPPNRQITIGFGCMLELLRMAAAEQGIRAEIAPFPDGEPFPLLNGNRIAQVRFLPGEAMPDPLFDNVLARRSLKEPYDTAKPVSDDLLSGLSTQANSKLTIGYTTESKRRKRLKQISWHAWMVEYETALTRRESIDLMRIGNREVTANPDGIEMAGIPMGLMNMAGIVTREALDTPGSTAYKTGIDMYREIINSAQGHIWVIADNQSRASQLEAGRTWVRLNLAAQAAGLGIHPLSQCLQEFPEMAEPYRAIHEELGTPADGVVHMFARVGYAKFPAPTPRWPLETRLINSTT